MSIILDPLFESPDDYQILVIKKILNKIKTHDDGLAKSAVTSSTGNLNLNKKAIENLDFYNKVCPIY